MYQKAYSLLGGKSTDFKDDSLLNIIQFLKIGLPEAMLDEAAKLMGLNKKHVISLIGKGPGNTSLKFGCRLSPNQSERMLMIIEVLAHTEQYHGNNAAALKWLNTSNVQLYNETPLNYLDTVIGIRLVSEELIKLSHGMTA
ncbi:antitoxin Xre/MbcA/ParS toxin-binding domain-containing protein [Shewanella frigidimarina]|uniref:Antitoxin Xre/MbcA/ParS-like toxin-binding domain-containing protein n=1 Tax=Shewanella frigidimarina TaxID=56812 RepID=A0A106C2I0_SHEFR|nr:antitoxin Xre/MbcA/ParS toxin-binding domain-containing protein [Shewanella frigidimarina]KVX03045.1 hypothetical protein AWJ07_00240 [Shewanella frigidimarina]